MDLLLRTPKSTEFSFFRGEKAVFLSKEILSRTYDEGFDTKEEKANLYKIGSYTSKIKNILHVEKLKNLNRPIEFRKANILYVITPDVGKKDTVNVIIREDDPQNPEKIKRLTVFSFVNGQLRVKRDIQGNITSKELLKFFRDFNIQLKEVDLIVKKEYEFYLIKKRLPGIFCADWKKPFKKMLYVKNDMLEIKNSERGVELEYTTKGKMHRFKMDKDFLLTGGDLNKLLFVLNLFSRELVNFDEKIGQKIQAEKEEYQSLVNNLGILFTPDKGNNRVRNFAKEYMKTKSNRLFISGDGQEINFIHKHSGLEKKWAYNPDKKLQPGSAEARDIYLVLKDFRKESEELKVYIRNKEEEEKRTDFAIISFAGKYPGVFMKNQNKVEFKDKDGGVLKVSAAEAFNAEGSKFFLTYEKGGASKHFYFAGKSLQSQTQDSVPFGAEKQNSLPGESKKTYYFNTDPVQLLSILKTFEPQISTKTE